VLAHLFNHAAKWKARQEEHVMSDRAKEERDSQGHLAVVHSCDQEDKAWGKCEEQDLQRNRRKYGYLTITIDYLLL
jgi:hypothetical protein